MAEFQNISHYVVLSNESSSRRPGHREVRVVTVPHGDVTSIRKLQDAMMESRRNTNVNPVIANAWRAVAMVIADERNWKKEEYPVSTFVIPRKHADVSALQEIPLSKLRELQTAHDAASRPTRRIISAFDPKTPK